jgi:hypothetical protein
VEEPREIERGKAEKCLLKSTFCFELQVAHAPLYSYVRHLNSSLLVLFIRDLEVQLLICGLCVVGTEGCGLMFLRTFLSHLISLRIRPGCRKADVKEHKVD